MITLGVLLGPLKLGTILDIDVKYKYQYDTDYPNSVGNDIKDMHRANERHPGLSALLNVYTT